MGSAGASTSVVSSAALWMMANDPSDESGCGATRWHVAVTLVRAGDRSVSNELGRADAAGVVLDGLFPARQSAAGRT